MDLLCIVSTDTTLVLALVFTLFSIYHGRSFSNSPTRRPFARNQQIPIMLLPNHHPTLSSTEATYSSLIQQYLSVFLVDNATFLAERLVATTEIQSFPLSIGTLSLSQWSTQAHQTCPPGISGKTTPEMAYLLAKSCHGSGRLWTSRRSLVGTHAPSVSTSANGK